MSIVIRVRWIPLDHRKPPRVIKKKKSEIILPSGVVSYVKYGTSSYRDTVVEPL